MRMMTNSMDLPLSVDRALGCRLLELPYRGRDVSMFLLLPDAHGLGALRELEAKLTPDVLEALMAARKDAPVIYSVPRMKLERSISLRTALETLGVRSLFNSQLADLTHLSQTVVERVDGSQPAASAAAPPPSASASAPSTTPASTSPATAAAQPVTTLPSQVKTSKRPPPSAGENAIGPDSQFYFANRMTTDIDKVNNSVEPQVVDRWSSPHTARLYADDVLHKVGISSPVLLISNISSD